MTGQLNIEELSVATIRTLSMITVENVVAAAQAQVSSAQPLVIA
jgi:hypothetical protein